MCPCAFHISVMVCLDLRKLSLDIFWFSSQRFIYPPVPLITFFIFVKTSWAFEAVITPLLHGYHSWFWFCHLVCASILEIFSLLMNVFKFSKKLELDPDISIILLTLVKLFMLHSKVTDFTSKSISCCGTAVWTMLFGAIVLSASAKSFKLSNFLERLAKGWKLFLGVETSDLFVYLCHQTLLDSNSSF